MVDEETLFPIAGIEWYYDIRPTLSLGETTITAGNTHASDPVLFCGTEAGVSSHAIIDGGDWLAIDDGTGGGTLYLNYHEQARWAQDMQAKQNLVLYFTFEKGVQQDNISIRNGNHPTTGWVPYVGADLKFGGFGFILHDNQIHSNVEYYHPSEGTTEKAMYPNGQTFQVGTEYRVFALFRTSLKNELVQLWVWIDFGNTGTWTQILRERTWNAGNWFPTSVPNSDDSEQITTGPHAIECYHAWIRNNSGGPADALKVKDLRIGTFPYRSLLTQ